MRTTLASNAINNIKIEYGEKSTSYSPYNCGSVDVKVENKNLFNKATAFAGWVDNTTGTINNQGAVGTRANIVSDYIYVKPNTNYYSSLNVYSWYYDKDKNYINYSGSSKLKTTPQNCNYIVIANSSSGAEALQRIDIFQLEEGSTATDYAPHEKQTVTFPLSEGQVLHLNDTLEDDGIHQRRKTIVLDGTENWKQGTQSSTLDVFYIDSITDYSISNNIPLCTHFIGISNIASATALLQNNIAFNNSHTNYRLYIKTNKFATVEELKTFLVEQYANGTPVTLEYELEEPIIVPYTENQEEVHDEIKKLYSYKGTTHISSDNEPSLLFTIQYVEEEE